MIFKKKKSNIGKIKPFYETSAYTSKPILPAQESKIWPHLVDSCGFLLILSKKLFMDFLELNLTMNDWKINAKVHSFSIFS